MNMQLINEFDKTVIRPFKEHELKIYAYTLPEVPNHDGCIKVGETSRDVESRISEQTKTVGLNHKILFQKKAKKNNGDWFHDKELHRYFILNKIEKKDFGNGADEWFYFNGNPEKCEELTNKFIACDYSNVGIDNNKYDYILRDEQREAVEKTYTYYKEGRESEFLWNAKPRFGKTLSSYDFMRKIGAKFTLVLTNRPAIANSWWEDFEKFIAWQEPSIKFISDTDALKNKAMTRSEFVDAIGINCYENSNIEGFVAFVSLQDLKGAKAFGGDFEKLQWVKGTKWDLLIIDEAHEGVDTFKSSRAFGRIESKFVLHLSGTPFKAIANNKFSEDQIYNWSYLDEQKAKLEWPESNDTNPYETLPTLSLFTYQMSNIIVDEVSSGLDLSEESNVDYAFDLNEFFKVKENGTSFVYEDSVNKFLDNLTARKFPFSDSEYRHTLNHTFWLLPGVAACKVMEKHLKNHDYFKDYKIVLAAGDGQSYEDLDVDDSIEKISEDIKSNEKSFDKVRKAIEKNDKTITLSCGQLTTGVTIPEWTAVFMLSNIKSPSLYFQAAFRAQNPYEFIDENTGELFRKENAYIFDFAPERTLVLFDEFANNLLLSSSNNTSNKRQENIKELLNFFPVIAEDENGEMYELDASKVLTIPNNIKSKEVVKQGFMSNLLFANISAIFRAQGYYEDILNKIQPEKNKRLNKAENMDIKEVLLDENGEVSIPKDIVINTAGDIFGEKIIAEDVIDIIAENFEYVPDLDSNKDRIKQFSEDLSTEIIEDKVDSLLEYKEKFNLRNTQIDKVVKKLEDRLSEGIESSIIDMNISLYDIKKKYENEIENAETEEEKEQKKSELKSKEIEIKEDSFSKIAEISNDIFNKSVEEQIVIEEARKKKESEDQVRDRLRGFARTIPAFIMAYGDRETRLGNFDEKVDEDTFEELTSITLDEFRKLRDGLIIEDEITGEEKEIPGLFDEIVFDSAIQEFLDTKEKLADYLKNENNKDIFSYIPSQKTNQIFTPRKVVKMMVDMLEKENPDIFRNPETRFIDLYVKSGLYMTEIIKRLDIGLKDIIIGDIERIKHIMENQVYGCAPSNIIYNIVKNYVYEGFDYVDNRNLLEVDLSKAAQEGRLKETLMEKRGDDVKFDVIIGNPPYQESDGGAQASAKPIYHYFVQEAKKMEPKYISLITPSRWFSGGKGLDAYRKEMLNDIRLKELHDWLTPDDIFPNTNIRGGVSYFLWDRSYNNIDNLTHVVSYKNNKIISDKNRVMSIPGVNLFIRDSIGCEVINKIFKFNNVETFDKSVSTRKPFGLEGSFINDDEFRSSSKGLDNFVTCYAKGWTKGFVRRELVSIRKEYIDVYKLFTPRANNIGTELPDDNLNAKIGYPGYICTESYIMLGHELGLEEISARNLSIYLKTKFARFMHSLAKASQDATSKTYKFVPLQDFTDKSDIDWTKSIDEIDEQLFDKYDLTEEERKHIRTSIKSM